MGLEEQHLYLRSKIQSRAAGAHDEDLALAIHNVQERVVDACKTAMDTFVPSHFANTCGMVRLGYSIIKQIKLNILKTDKDGGFAITSQDQFARAGDSNDGIRALQQSGVHSFFG